MIDIKITFRGWQGHFCGQCQWHLNTLIEYNSQFVVVSTVGQWIIQNQREFQRFSSSNHLYETMVFVAQDDQWHDANVSKQLNDYTKMYMTEEDAQQCHYVIVDKIKELIQLEPKKFLERFTELSLDDNN